MKYASGISVYSTFESLPITPHDIRGIFISANAYIGKECVIFHQVTIGSNTLLDSKKSGTSTIGNNCYIGVGAKKIELSNDCIYRVVTRNGSLRRKNTLESNIVRLLADCRSFNLLKERGLYNEIKPVVISTMQYWINIFCVNKSQAIKLIPTVVKGMDFKTFCNIIYRNKKKY